MGNDMEKVAIVGCGAYMDSGYGCTGEWRCLKAAAVGEGNFKEPSQVIALVKCECPGRPLASNMGMAIKLSEMKSGGKEKGCRKINSRSLLHRYWL